ncbi:N-acetylglucosaminyldiphosphoundecaprenol N-acetyl-beta-D-mannosaminyltransferase [Melghiribacillus thermohalophilus]|uniref:N-acetylglucosaminyldiphosphoundecaprenol N-acetyl-beta-D-mannosaminyltransferase n=1 Tax=Melghiribacillus thermohalophilus TaxID=1324956 RepID=A0A4V6NZX1_9BACI|nr:WecB/TagA/CpsF family glycosyltransferase [Melghiribacillus thermohalophilus]TCT19882.1 N-acetylglucosaminyldiphosphoundecaprenol N-acetyl-beta-D-mannosaminyltransferase [Melghiribacillus thermohalophilus]
MEENRINILDIPFIHSTKKQFFHDIIIPSVENQRKLFIVTANPEIVMYANENPAYKKNILQADCIVADGVGIILASKLIRKPLPERIPGFELMELMLGYANQNKKSIFLFGAKDYVVKKAAQNIRKKYPDILIAGYHHGYVDLNDNTVLELIKHSNPDFVFVALGYPRQENWISRNMKKLNKGIYIGVGGSFDVWGGKVNRAPRLWRNLNLEWLYRIITNPKRYKRAAKLPKFVLHVLREKWKGFN